MLSCPVVPPDERRDEFLSVVATLANNDDAIKLLPLRLMNRHHLNPIWVINPIKELVLG